MSTHKHLRRNTEESIAELSELGKTQDLEKASKNVREQKKKVFGTQAQPTKGSAMREKQMSHLQDFVKRRYGLELQPSGGKISEETGERRSENPEIGVDKPDWRSGKFEAQWSPDAAVHEAAHLELMPEGVDLPGGQRLMDQQYADIQRQHGYMKQKQSSFEKEPMALENPIRRRAGLPPTRRDVPVKEGAPERRTVDTNEPAAVRVQRGKKVVDQMAHAKLLRPESRQRQEDIDQGIIRYDPSTGWHPSSESDALVNLRGQGRMEEAKSRLQQKYKPQESAPSSVDLSNLSPEDHAAVQEFLKQRKSKLAASEMEKAHKSKGSLVRNSLISGAVSLGMGAADVAVDKVKEEGKKHQQAHHASVLEYNKNKDRKPASDNGGAEKSDPMGIASAMKKLGDRYE